MLLSVGNNVHRHSIPEILIGIVGIVFIVILPPLKRVKWNLVDTTLYDDFPVVKAIVVVVSLTIGMVLLLLQFANIVRYIVPDSKLTKSKLLTTFLRGSAVRSEFGLKQAANFKVHTLVKNAYELHQIDEADSNSQSSNQTALLNFTKVTEKRETCGGFVWSWKLLLSGKLIENEGIW
jgi:hypothetical protein